MSMGRHDSGLSLVELMISMLLASIIAAAAIGMLVTDTQSSRFQINQTSMQTSGRFAFDFLLADIRRAGYSALTPIPVAIEGTNGLGGESDTLIIRYDAALTQNRDCLGNVSTRPPTENAVTNVYRIQSNGGQNTLVCNDVPVMRGVDALQVMLGVDVNQDGRLDRYVSPDAVAAGQRVLAVQVAMLVATLEQGGENVVQQYSLLNETVGPFQDRRGRTLYATTERIRNVNMDDVL